MYTCVLGTFDPYEYQRTNTFLYSDSTNVTDDTPSTQPSSGTGSTAASSGGSHSRSVAGPVAGGVVGGVVLIAAIIFGLWWYRRRGRRKAASVSPFINKGRQPFDGMVAVTPEDKNADIAQTYVPSALKLEDEMTEISPSTARSNDVPFSSYSGQDDDTLHADVQVLREELASLVRSSQATPISGTPAASTIYSSPSRTTGSKLSREHASSIENEIRSLRQEVQQLRAQQEVRNVPGRPLSTNPSPAGGISLNLVQEIASLRSEMEELRMQQEILAGPLPDYSPPEGPLPGFTNVGVVEQAQELTNSQDHPHPHPLPHPPYHQ
ncbi:hypothetical protein BC629DRAFT_1110863 [Irpex lacteus]|nr:hypothetical protein BC629DRAFT_1110863 [Irpex lacteus]